VRRQWPTGVPAALAAQQEADRETVPLKEAVRRQWSTVPLVAQQEADREAAVAAPLDLKP